MNEDRYRTTSWNAGEVRRAAGEPQQSGERQPEAGPRPAAPRPKKKRRRKRRTNPFLALLLWIVIVAASSVICASVGWMLANDFAALNKSPLEVKFQVTEDMIAEVTRETQDDGTVEEVTHYDMGKITAALKEKGLIEYDWFFRLFCRFYNADTKITEGTFTLNTNMDYMALIRNMRTRGGSAVTVDVSIPEGFTVAQIIDLLAENGVGTVEKLTDVAENYVFDQSVYPFVNNEDLGDISRLEGYLFPDTYNFYVGGQPELAFTSMLKNFNSKVYSNEDFTDLFNESAYSLDEILTIASLVERETDGSDRAKIASVIYNRLNNDGETGHLLQIDAALVYAAGRSITQEDYTSLDSPYNLYQHTGLPPTPIANPGIASIRAALQPEETNYYFYVLVGDKHVFSETLSQHNKNVAAAAAAAEN
ncbi:MAG: endolytic transglycosylase MltG [Oscillospiraceae bacterium]|jgi:UPF0755 protein|nr:endolytic transglycosylase MltG [Oscillospiraceae bacterium]